MAQSTQLRRCQYHEHKGSAFRLAFPGLHTLQETCFSKICKMIVKSCRKRLNEIFNFDENRRAIRQFFSQLPVTVREQILEHLSKKYEPGKYPFRLYLNEVLFSVGMRKLIFTIGCDCRQNHVENFFNLALVEGIGLRTLKFDCRSYDPIQFHVTIRIYQHLKQIFVSAEHLVDLKLTDIGDDTIVKMIGENCTRLQKLKLSLGNISDKGIHYLTQNFVRHPTETVEAKRVWDSTLWRLPGIFPALEELLPEGEPVKFYERKKSPLCSTMKFVDIDYYEFEPMLALIELIPGLEGIGKWVPHYFLLEIWKKWFKVEERKNDVLHKSLNLTSIGVGDMDERIFDMLATICPKLRHIRYSSFEPNSPSTFSLSSFNRFIHLESLEIRHSNSVLHTEKFGDLSEEIRKRLTTVSIKNPLYEKPFNVSDIHACSELQRLTLKFPHISWRGVNLMPPRDTMEKLSFVELRGKVTGKAILSILECAPNLEYLTVCDIIERSEDFLYQILGMRKMPELETFEVLEGFLLDTEDELRSFVTHFPKIQHVGKVRFLSN